MDSGKIEIERDRYPFVIMEKAIFDDHRTIQIEGKPVQISKHEILTYAAVCYFADGKKGTAFPSYDTISDVARLGRTTVYQALKVLVLFGYLDVKNRRKRNNETGDYYQTSNLYTILSQYKVTQKRVVDNSKKKGGLSSPHELTPVRPTNSNKNYITRISSSRGGVLVDNFMDELESTFKIYSDLNLIITETDRHKLSILVEKHGAEKVLEVWSNYQKQKPGKPINNFVEDFGLYNKTIAAEPTLLKLKNRPDICPVCESSNLKLGSNEAFKCLDYDSFWEHIGDEWAQVIGVAQ